jgi:hypothetical protein
MSRNKKITFVNGEDTQINLPELMAFHGKIDAIKENGKNGLISLIFTLRKFSRWPEFQKELKIDESIEWQYSDKIRIKITLDDIRIVNISYRAYTERQIIADIKFEY